MSTPSVIARWTNREAGLWAGVYCHWGGYPNGVGRELWHLYHSTYIVGGLRGMLRFLIDDHLEGWSIIVGVNWSLQPTWIDPKYHADYPDYRIPPLSYRYRTDLIRKPWRITQYEDNECEWAYVFDEDQRTMTIFKRSERWWCPVTELALEGPEPGWEALSAPLVK